MRPKPFVGFFQAGDGTGYAYTVQARSDIEAAERIKMHFEPEFGEECGEILCYSPTELRRLADSLQSPNREFDVPMDDTDDVREAMDRR